MGIYGHKFDEYKPVELTEQEIQDTLFIIYQDIAESSLFEDDEDILEEGANLDMRRIWKESKKEYKAHLKASKKYLRSGDKDNAAKELDKAIKILKDNRDRLANVDDNDNIGSAVLGFFAYELLSYIEILIPMIGSGIGFGLSSVGMDVWYNTVKTGVRTLDVAAINKSAQLAKNLSAAGSVISFTSSIAGAMISIINFIKDLITFINEIKKEKGDLDVKHFNLYRVKLLRYMDDAIKKVEKLRDSIKDAEVKKENKK